MARNDQRRQKKLEAKRVKRKEQLRDVSRLKSSGMGERMLAGCRWPITESRVSGSIWEDGIGYAVLVRRGPGGTAAMSLFLLDVYCLGVKNVVAKVDAEHSISAMLARLNDNGTRWIKVSPEHVRKLVEGSVGYALNLGLAPHRECAAAMKLFGDIDASQCSIEFVFGCEGKPRYISGPNDSAARSKAVVDALHRTCGPDGFHYVVHLDNPENLMPLEGEWDDDEQRSLEEDEPEGEAELDVASTARPVDPDRAG